MYIERNIITGLEFWNNLSTPARRREIEYVSVYDCRRLLDKEERVEAIAASLSGGDDAQKEEIEQTITPPERTQLAKTKHVAGM
jgi:hypothetical protein